MSTIAITETLGQILAQSIALKASDIHITSGVETYMRVDKGLVKVSEERLTPEVVEGIAYAMMSASQRKNFERDHSLDLAFFSDTGTRFRVNVFRQRGTIAIVIRRLEEVTRSFEDLHLPPQMANIADFHNGLVLVTGPTGSGKSTTLAAVINKINTNRSCHIMTIEDPVEYVHRNAQSLVRQRELHSDVDTFASAVRAALREDPDVILVGEMRDLETMRAAITAGETGHLIFSTLHTNDVVGAVSRMISLFPADEQKSVREQLSRVLRAVISQRLVPRCDAPGRIPVLEILQCTSAVSNLIRTGETHQIYSLLQTGASDGMLLLEQSLADFVAAGLIRLGDATSLAREPGIFETRLQLAQQARKAAEPVKKRGFSLLRA